MEINDDAPSETYSVKCGALLRIFERYKQIKSFDGYDDDDVSHSFLSIVRYALRFLMFTRQNLSNFGVQY